MSVEEGVLLACGGFLLAVLWMDLIFDTQVRAVRGDELPEPVLASIAGYYHRATTTSRPMSHLIAAVMVILLGALAFRALRGHDPVWLTVASAAARRRAHPAGPDSDGAQRGSTRQSVWTGLPNNHACARSVCRDHLVCVVCVFAFLVVRLIHAAVT